MTGPSSPRREDLSLHGGADSQPMKGMTICFTSIPDEKRAELAGYAEQMGASVRYDLTLGITHLIVGDYNTPKYRYVAKERPDIQPMTSQWIETMRELWINDSEIDVNALEKEHRLPTFSFMKFSMTGCDDAYERQQIADTVKANGATYEGDLTKQITHLVSFRTEGAKYKAAKSWGLSVVSIEWIHDSLERGMILDESLYDPLLPLEERGKDAWNRAKSKRSSLQKRTRNDGVTGLEGKRKLRRTASNKLTCGNENLWGDIVAGGPVVEVARSGVWESNETLGAGKISQKDEIKKGTETQATNPPLADQGMFKGCRFFCEGFAAKEAEILHSHLLSNGGFTALSAGDLVDTGDEPSARLFRIIPADVHESMLPDPPVSKKTIQTLTFWWVERCLHSKTFIEPAEHVIGRPFPKFPIEGFEEMTVNSAAFTGIDLLHVKRAVELIGATYSEDMTPQSSVLVTRVETSLRKDRLDYAQAWAIPIVNASWLWECIATGTKIPIKKYRFRAVGKPQMLAHDSSSSNQGVPLERARSDSLQPSSRQASRSSEVAPKPHRISKRDTTAFAPDEQVSVKNEPISLVRSLVPHESGPSSEPLAKTEPLSERSHNSPTRVTTMTTAITGPPREDMSLAISSLLAKTKTSTNKTETSEDTRKRGNKRILGRCTSTLSSGSRASSVDSTTPTTASNVQFTGSSNPTKDGPQPTIDTGNRMTQFPSAENDRHLETAVDSQPPATQLEYDDPQSEIFKERMARALGEKVDSKRTTNKQRAVTLGDLSATMGPKPRSRKTRGESGLR